MKFAGLIVVALVASLAGCSSGVESKAKEAVAAQLKDPTSAQFQSLKVGKTSKGFAIVCGEVNAKNAFGGYTGFTSFVWREGNYGAHLAVDGEGAYLVNDLIAALCAGQQQAYLDQVMKGDRYSPKYRELLKLQLQKFDAP